MSYYRYRWILLMMLGVNGASRADDAVFRDRVAPILQSHCIRCHNDLDREGELSLQTAADLLEESFIEPGDSAGSHLLSVVSAQDGDRPSMPKDADPLSEQQVAAIRQWIDAGAEWPEGVRLEQASVSNLDWWSLKPLSDATIPAFQDAGAGDWIRNPIDAFVLSKLRVKGLSPSSEADRRTLIRRVTYDLIGLPPMPEQVDAFLVDDDPMAYEKLVDQLLLSPHYGERWARHWLDVVRYADTCGYDKDKLRPHAWPYRDYVVRSINEDKPYWRFVQEQIAGDVLFPGEPDGILGLGFIAAGPWDFIGHVEVPESKIDGMEARNLDRDEMVSSTLNTFCSATVQCARCHNHKFDPFTQEHYYSLQAVFAAVDRADRPYDLDPEVESKRNELAAALRRLRDEKKKIDDGIKQEGGEELVVAEKRVTDLQARTSLAKKRPEFGFHSQIVNKQETSKWVQVDLGRKAEIKKIVLRPCHDDFGGIGAGFGFPVRFRVAVSRDGESWQVVGDYSRSDFVNPGLATVEVACEVAPTRFVRLTATKLAERSKVYILALAELQVLDGNGENLALRSTVTALDSIEAPVRWAKTNLTDGIWAEATDSDVAGELIAAKNSRQAILDRINTPERTDMLAKLQQHIESNEQELAKLPKGRMVYAAATDFMPQGNFKPTTGNSRTVRLLHRGNITQPRDEMQPGALPIVPDVDWRFSLGEEHSESERRAALAKWITSPDHPLTWRSIVNRVWLYHFGRGIVDSPNDFGRMGQLPSDPQLLDWLAREFRDGGQSMRQLHRLIVTSNTYRQSSADDAEKGAIDGDNQYLWRMNRRRLEAEEIRDSILSVSGRLNPQMGGPGYYLFVLEKTTHSPHYEYHLFDPDDVKSHRRSLYRFVVRSQPDPYMTTLDCADSSQSTPRRNETLTAIQALSMLNNQFTLVMSGHFANRLRSQSNSLREQVADGYRLVTQRQPDPKQRRRLEAYGRAHGLENLCRLLLNLSEFVYLD